MASNDILLIDDEIELSEVMAELLTEDGYSVRMVSRAQDALDLLAFHTFSLIICDLNMPEMTGLELLRELRRRRCLTCVVVLTAYSADKKIIEAMRLGAIDFVVKPAAMDYLLAKAAIWTEIGMQYRNLVESLDSSQNIPTQDILGQLSLIELFRVLNNKAA